MSDITMTTEIGNGSRGKVAFSTYNHKGKLGINFQSILVEDLVEYVHKERDNDPKTALGTVSGGYNSDTSKSTQRSAEEIDVDNEVPEEGDDIFGDDLPFDDDE